MSSMLWSVVKSLPAMRSMMSRPRAASRRRLDAVTPPSGNASAAAVLSRSGSSSPTFSRKSGAGEVIGTVGELWRGAGLIRAERGMAQLPPIGLARRRNCRPTAPPSVTGAADDGDHPRRPLFDPWLSPLLLLVAKTVEKRQEVCIIKDVERLHHLGAPPFFSLIQRALA
jgi:hypothetical protein